MLTALTEEGLVQPDSEATEGMSEADRLFYEKACEIFDTMDEDGSGTIDMEELHSLLQNLGMTDPYECRKASEGLSTSL